LAHSERLQGHCQRALQTLEAILRIHPSDATPWYDIGVVYEGMGDQEKAHSYFQRFRQEMEVLWKKDPNNADTAFCLAGVLSRLGQKENAMSWPWRLIQAPTPRQPSLAKSLCLCELNWQLGTVPKDRQLSSERFPNPAPTRLKSGD
jgi:hypothetical protein